MYMGICVDINTYAYTYIQIYSQSQACTPEGGPLRAQANIQRAGVLVFSDELTIHTHNVHVNMYI